MTDIKHTPWTIEYEDFGEMFIVDASGDIVAQVDDDNGLDEQAKSIIKACNSYYESQATISSQEATIRELVEALEDCAEYFEDLADANQPSGSSPIPNKEMQLMVAIESAISKVKGQTDEK